MTPQDKRYILDKTKVSMEAEREQQSALQGRGAKPFTAEAIDGMVWPALEHDDWAPR